jgi:hypothetical protein
MMTPLLFQSIHAPTVERTPFSILRSNFTASIRSLASVAISRRAVAKTSAMVGADDRDDGAC